MKRVFAFTIISSLMFVSNVFGQQKKDSCCISKKQLIGIWQRDSKIVGSGLNQNFQFNADGTFIFNVGSYNEDARDLIKLKGRFRLDQSDLYFTITSRTYVEGKINIEDPGISLAIFSVDGKIKEVAEVNPKEIPTPCYISLYKDHIRLNAERYYKIKKKDL
jgi:hypothetical protein